MILKSTLLSAALLATGLSTYAQLSGPYTVPGSYPTIASAITALNTSGVSGAVTINIAAGYAETAPAGGLQLGTNTLNATLSATNTLTFVKAGAGADPVITAPVGTTLDADAIFTLSGTDYVTIDGIDLQESGANTTPATAVEEGYALLNLNATAPFDGASNNTIRNCTITLNRSVSTTLSGIYVAHNVVGTTTALTITDVSDANSYNKFYANTITNVLNGINVQGYNAPAPYTLYDQGNEIGGSAPGTGNTLTNLFGATPPTTLVGINGINQNNFLVGYNTIDQLANGGVNATSSTRGVFLSGVNSTFTVTNNTILLSEASANTANTIYGIYISGTNAQVTTNGNRVTLLEPAGLACNSYGIYNAGTTGNFTATGNRVTQNNTVGSSTANVGTTNGIFSGTNGIIIITLDTVTQTNVAGANAQYYAILAFANAVSEDIEYNALMNMNVTSSGSTGATCLLYSANTTTTKTISNNYILGTYTHNSAFAPNTYGILASATTTGGTGNATFSNNNLSNITITGGTFYGIRLSSTVASNQALVISGNTIANLSTNATAYGMLFGPTVASPQNATITGNTLSNFNGTASFLMGIGIQSGGTVNVTGNVISGFTNSGAGAVYGIYAGLNNTYVTATSNIGKNKITDLQSASNYAGGIVVIGSVINNIYNNLVGNLRCPAGNNASFIITGLDLEPSPTVSSLNVYYNTVYLAATSTGANFSTNALFHLSSASAAKGTLDLRNNILINNSTPSGSGLAGAFTRNGAGANFAATSDRNLLYAGTPGTNHLLYSDGTNKYQTQADYRAGLAPAESHSVTENPTFASISGASPLFLHFAPGTTTLAESRGSNIAGYPDDFDGNARQGNPGYTGTGTAPDLGAAEGEMIASNPLAVTLDGFGGHNKGAVNELYWKTLGELSTDGFELERSTTGNAFSRIATIRAIGRASNYSYVDAAPVEGNNYYRLKMLELSGKATYSHTIVLSAAGTPGALSLAPNPVRDVLTVQLPSTGATIQLLDATGRKLWETKAAGTTQQVSMSSYPAGHYFIRYSAGNDVQTRGFNKQ